MYMYIHAHMRNYTHTSIHIQTCPHRYIYRVRGSAHIDTIVHGASAMCAFQYAHMCVCTYVCMYIYNIDMRVPHGYVHI